MRAAAGMCSAALGVVRSTIDPRTQPSDRLAAAILLGTVALAAAGVLHPSFSGLALVILYVAIALGLIVSGWLGLTESPRRGPERD